MNVSLFDVQYQDRAQRLLQRALAAQRMPHAYIFAGPDGVGKRMLAHRLGKLLLCADRRKRDWPDGMADTLAGRPATDLCGACDDCRWMDADTHPDFHRVYKELIRFVPGKEAHKATALGVDVVRRFLIEPAGQKAARGRAKVFVIEEADSLSDSAQNAMLKTLEEPPDATFIILLTTSSSKLLPTTLSRSQLVGFGTLPSDFTARHLTEKCGVDAETARYLSRRSSGLPGLAVEWADQGYFGLKQELLGRLASLDVMGVEGAAKWIVGAATKLSDEAVKRNPVASETEVRRRAIVTLLGAIGSLLRDGMLLSVDAGEELVENVDQRGIVEAVSGRLGLARLGELVRGLAEVEAFLASNANPALTLENWLLRFVQPAERRLLPLTP